MIQLEPVTKDDFNKLAEIYKRAYNSLEIGENWDTGSAKKLLEHLYKEQPDLFFVAKEGHKLIGGVVAIVKPWWDGNHITDGEIFVDPDFQAKGVGKMLLKKLFGEALERYQAVSWDTFTHRVHEHPLKWYKKLGFEEIEQWVMITGDIKKVLNKI